MHKTFSITTLGCKVNQYESQQIRQLLEQSGLTQVEACKGSDIAVVNSCCVTHIATAKSRQYLNKIRKMNPKTFIIFCGCLPSSGDLGDSYRGEGKTIVVKHREDLAATLTQLIKYQDVTCNCNIEPITNSNQDIKPKNEEKIKEKKLTIWPKLSELTAFKGHTRAFLKIQDGCDGHCSYCVIPRTRPIISSKNEENALKEAADLAAAGHKEIVVTGIFLGAYGKNTVRRNKWENGENNVLADFLGKLAKVDGAARIRLSSLEPGDVTEKLLDVFCENRNIMPHLHLSLQSGSDFVLRRMCRQYSVEDFRRAVEMIKNRLDRPAITCDLIVGFPGESEEDFRMTIELARETGFSKMHVFPFSARKGTAAAKMQGVVKKEVMKERSKILRELDIELGRKFREQFIGEKCTVLVENADGRIEGKSERYFDVEIRQGEIRGYKKNDLVEVRLVGSSKSGLIGQVE